MRPEQVQLHLKGCQSSEVATEHVPRLVTTTIELNGSVNNEILRVHWEHWIANG